MAAMKDFAIWLLDAIADFLSSEPMIYIFSFILLIIVLRFFLLIIGVGSSRKS